LDDTARRQHNRDDLRYSRWNGCRPPTASQCAKVVVYNATKIRGQQMKDKMIEEDLVENLF